MEIIKALPGDKVKNLLSDFAFLDRRPTRSYEKGR
jgi:hypothetical protein